MLHTLLLVPSIFSGLVMVFIMALAIHLVNDGKILARTRTENGVSVREGTFLRKVGLKGWVYAILVGVVFWFVIYLGPTFTTALWVSPILYCLMLAFIVGLIIWWLSKAYGLGEIICFTVMALAFTWAALAEGQLFAMLCGGGAFIASLLTLIPWVFFVVAVGSFLIDSAKHYKTTEERDKEHKIAEWDEYALIVIFTLGLIFMFIFGLKWNALDTKLTKEIELPVKNTTETVRPAETPKETAEPAATEKPAETAPAGTSASEDASAELVLLDDEFVLSKNDWYDLRHWAVLGGDKADDDDFGKNPLDEILAKKVADGELTVKDISGKTEKELYGLVTFEELFDKFVEELDKDPVKGAAVMGYYDVIHGTNFLGSFSTELLEHKDALMEKINQKAREWLADRDEYLKVLTAFVATLQRSDEMEISYAANGLDDQMYMWGTTPDHVPVVVVMESTNHSGYLLTFRDYIKGTTKLVVNYRINCDFQPTNVSKVANVTVNPNPAKPSTGGGGSSTGGGGEPITGGGAAPSTGGGGTTGGGGGNTPPVTNPKDPTKGTPVGSNTGKGPGPNTNNGVGATWSTEEEPTNSLHENLGEYWEDVAELKEPQKEAGDPNTPTYTPPPAENPPKQDNNGDKGTGNGGADTPSDKDKAPEATYKDPETGKDKSLDDEPPGEEWVLGA
ncbi:hypothetical protein IKF12_00465 [Candidatus Saccharibacteria bacterium]|nr:hypothetical protein [Candidatus Saccharibacteria bacterium]